MALTMTSIFEQLETRRHLTGAAGVVQDASGAAQFASLYANANVAAQVAPRRVFLIGNSLTDGVFYQGLTKLLQRGGTPVSLGRQTGSGYTQYKNYALAAGFRTSGNDIARPGVSNPWGNYRSAFSAGQWDAVTLQLHERRFFADTYKGANEADGAVALAFMRELQINSPNAQPFIYSRPSRRTDVTSSLQPTGKSFDYSAEWLRTYVDTGSTRNSAYFSRSYITQFMPQLRARQDADISTMQLKPARLIPVGEAYFQVDQMLKKGLFAGTPVTSILNFYTDQSHPTYNLASYVIGLTFHSAITGEDPRGVSVPTDYLFGSSPLSNPRVVSLVQQAVFNAMTLGSYSSYSTPLDSSQVARGQIRATVNSDANGNGIFESNEPPVEGVRVYLDINGNGAHDPWETNRVTGSNGRVGFNDVVVGQYNVRTLVPAGFSGAVPSVFNAVVTPNATTSAIVMLRPGTLAQPGTVVVAAFNDANKDGNQDAGESVLSNQRIYLDLNNNNTLDTNEPNQLSSATGVVTFNDLTPGSYMLRQSPGSDAFTLASEIAVQVQSGAVTNVAVPLMFVAPTTGSIAVKIFNDLNRNSTQTPDEPGVQNVSVYVDSNNDGVFNIGEPSGFTEQNGNVVFGGLAPGSYRIRFVTPTGFERIDASSDQVNVSAGATSPVTIALALRGGTGGGGIGSGTSSVRGTVVNDLNKNKSWTSGEYGITGRTVWIDLDNDKIRDANEPSRVTDAAGRYSFDGIAAGTYYVRQVVATGWVATQPTAGFALAAAVATGAVRGNINFFTAVA